MVAPGLVRVTVAVTGPGVRRLVGAEGVAFAEADVRRLVAVVDVVGPAGAVDLLVGVVAVAVDRGAVDRPAGWIADAGDPEVATTAGAGAVFDDEGLAVQAADKTNPEAIAATDHRRNVEAGRRVMPANPNGPVMRRRCGTAAGPTGFHAGSLEQLARSTVDPIRAAWPPDSAEEFPWW